MRPVNAVLLVFLLSFPSLVLSVELRGTVVAISDGDTITVLDDQKQQYKVRLSGIDAPEKKQAFGERSRQNLAALVFQKPVIVEWYKRDRYQRILGKVFVADVDANLEQVKAGFAWWYEHYAKEQPLADQQSYASAQTEARAARRGLWGDSNPLPPWDFRRPR